MLSKILAFFALNQSASVNSLLLQRLLAGVGAIIFLSLITAFLTSILIGGFICIVYSLMISNGVSEPNTLFALGTIILFLLVIFGVVAAHYGRKVKRISRQIMAIENPLASRVNRLIEAFMTGLTLKKSYK